MAEGGGPACGGGQQPPPPAAPRQLLCMNWLHFKPEFSGKSDEDVEAHLLRTNDWMTTHDFPEAVKVQRFCLTLVGEARNWYATLEPVAMMWPELQNMFRHQYSKIGNTREQLFHAWRSFHYDENVETPDAYVIRIKQVARLLGYEDLQVLEVFKNTVPKRLYWVLFSIDNCMMLLRQQKDSWQRKRLIDKWLDKVLPLLWNYHIRKEKQWHLRQRKH